MRTKSDLPIEQLDAMITKLEDEKGYKLCGYPSKTEEAPFVDICENKAGKSTDHVGEGHCVFHGGGGAPKTAGGLYSKFLRKKPEIYERYQTFLEDSDIKKIDSEIHLIRTLLSQRIDTDEGWENTDTGKVDLSIIRLVDTISRLVERKNRMETGEKYVITVENLSLFLVQVVNVIKQEVVDPSLQIKILKRLQEEVRV